MFHHFGLFRIRDDQVNMVVNATIGALVSSVGRNLADSLTHSVSPTANVLFSPLSIFAALFMLLFGTAERSQSQSELLRFFGSPDTHSSSLPNLAESFHNFFQPLMGDHEGVGPSEDHNATFLLANSLWGEAFKQSYVDLNREKLFASVFSQTPTATKVNQWVAKNTKNHITGILPPGFRLDPQSLLLVNTVFFHGMWKNEFKASRTTSEEFQVLSGAPIKVKMMNSFRERWAYSESEKYQVLDMPYTDDRFVATVVLPREVQSFASFTHSLSEEDWTDILEGDSASKRMKNFLAENTAVHSLPNSVVYQLNEINRAIKKPSKKE
ncbi:hypothetical protein K493DRAFT_410538 [Basidiobolus meristosporus CBS 931.73]|uniref:Serpin domain-containing protein n=1 Tax=Basidiobolus meristosporus CBS 931.73 TaxID=1314790 RepID=A0A1Y1XUU9_9FUNG|nr:hypothetical protein K493DRAFT_410538 [Basidiobolus meristosporus CBS 931.73]|eukprot:ORX89266.1 hypothetical protein K493DRAFT_410538 [Basidiobolus meristosporus CBS 931.73]